MNDKSHQSLIFTYKENPFRKIRLMCSTSSPKKLIATSTKQQNIFTYNVVINKKKYIAHACCRLN